MIKMREEVIYIYALINPINNQVFYIGASLDPANRLHGHNWSISCCKAKIDVVKEIRKSGQEIELLILDECYKSTVRFLEEFYMDLYSSFGFTLLQHRKSTYSIKHREGIIAMS